VSNVGVADAGIYQVKVSNNSSFVMSDLVTVTVDEALGVKIISPSKVNRGDSVNLIANVSGTGDIKLQWFKDLVAIQGGTSSQLRINAADSSDNGSYTVVATNVSTQETKTSEPVTLDVVMIPLIKVHPVSRTVSSGPVVFSVVVNSSSTPHYKWLRDGSVVGTDSPYLKLTGPLQAGLYTVEIRNDANSGVNDAPVVTSARLTVLGSSESAPPVVNAGSDGTTSAFTAWWVYWVSGKHLNGSASAESRSGYWITERASEMVDGKRVVSKGRSAWLLDSVSPAPPLTLDTVDGWLPEDQTLQDASASERSEFSVLAERVPGLDQPVSFTLAGRVQTAGDASIYGAPELMSGAYDLGSGTDDDLNVDLVWDAEQVLLLGGDTDFERVKSTLITNLEAEAASLPGE